MRITLLWASSKFHISGRIQPKILLTLFTTHCHSWAQGWETFSDSVFFPMKEFDAKGSLRQLNVCSAWPLKERERARLVLAITSASLFAPASAPGELEMHRRNQKTWVETWLCQKLPMWLWVSYLISLGLSFSTGLLWELSNMINENVLSKFARSIETWIFIVISLASFSPIHV